MYGIVPRRLASCITRNINAVLLFQPTQNKGDQKGPHYQSFARNFYKHSN